MKSFEINTPGYLCTCIDVVAQDKMKDLTGPGTWEQWTRWKSRSQDHKNRSAAKTELEKLLSAERVST